MSPWNMVKTEFSKLFAQSVLASTVCYRKVTKETKSHLQCLQPKEFRVEQSAVSKISPATC